VEKLGAHSEDETRKLNEIKKTKYQAEIEGGWISRERKSRGKSARGGG